MSNPIRYTGKTKGSILGSPHWEHPEGEWVKYEDYARLRAEVERLEHQVNYWRIEAETDNARWLRCLKDYDELRASSFVTAVPVEHYERVVKAGDLLCFHYISLARKRWPDDPLPSSVTAWSAAKEGKPSA